MEFTRRRRLLESPESIALADLVFLALVFFLLSSSLFLEHNAKVEAEGAPGEDLGGDIVLAIAADGSLRLNGEPVGEEELPGRLAARLAASRAKAVSIQGEETVPFGRIVRLMDLAREQGARRLSLEGEP